MKVYYKFSPPVADCIAKKDTLRMVVLCREYEQQNKKPQNIEVKNIVLFLSKTSAVRNSLLDLPAIASRSGEAGGYSIFKIQNRLNPAPSGTGSPALYNLRQSQLSLTTPIEDPAMRGRTWFSKDKINTQPRGGSSDPKLAAYGSCCNLAWHRQ